MSTIEMNDQDLRRIASALRYLEGRDGECSSNRRVWCELAGAIEEQVKPAVEEPEAFGSTVRADRLVDGIRSQTMLWHRVQINTMKYWQSNTGVLAMWSELTDVEVLRVGLGGASGESYRKGFEFGLREMNTQIHTYLTSRLDQAITAERKHELEKAIQAVEELTP